MSFESHQAHATVKPDVPTPVSDKVNQEAAKIIDRMDGSGDFSKYLFGNPQYDTQRALQVRDMLVKDSQTYSPKDMKDLMITVMNGENHKKGYDLEIFGHSTREVREKTEHIDMERQNLGMVMANCSPEERKAAFTQFNKDHDKELADYKKELVLTLTHFTTPGEYGEKGRSWGDMIQVAPYRNAGGLPDFHIVNDK